MSLQLPKRASVGLPSAPGGLVAPRPGIQQIPGTLCKWSGGVGGGGLTPLAAFSTAEVTGRPAPAQGCCVTQNFKVGQIVFSFPLNKIFFRNKTNVISREVRLFKGSLPNLLVVFIRGNDRDFSRSLAQISSQ